MDDLHTIMRTRPLATTEFHTTILGIGDLADAGTTGMAGRQEEQA